MGYLRSVRSLVLAATIAAPLLARAEPARIDAAAITSAAEDVASSEEKKHSRLPFLAEEARKRGYELPLPYGVGLVYYHLDRDIEVEEVRVGRNGADLVAVPDFAVFKATSDVENLNAKVDVWVLPFLNVYAIVGGITNDSNTTLELTLPPITPGGEGKQFSGTVPTSLNGSVAGLGITAAGGYKSFLVAIDVNSARADIGFDDRFKALVSSLRAGWHGTAGGRPLRIWTNATYWDTFATAKGTVDDGEGGTLEFEVDQGPRHPWTYGLGFSYSIQPTVEFNTDIGFDFHGGWYVAVVPVWRFGS